MEDLVVSKNVEGIKQFLALHKSTPVEEEYMQSVLDGKLRSRGMELARSSDDTVEVAARAHLQFVLQLSLSGICSRTAAVQMMQDMVEVSGIGRCERLFGILEDNMMQFKQPPLGEVSQTYILRMCNDLLKRLSRSAETSFCGRILFFLSRVLSLSEKSGLNLMGNFNTQNVTKFDMSETQPTNLITETPDVDEGLDPGEIKDSKEAIIPVDHSLYTMFWQMQSFFSNPNTCYEKLQWKMFQKNASEVLNVFASYKLERSDERDDDDGHKKGKKRKRTESKVLDSAEDVDSYFAKYLTSPKLLQLQLNDSQFRRYFLLQCIILFQYLTADIKFKQKTHILTEEQSRFVSDNHEKCLRLLKETHPRGNHFTESVKRILQRESEWSAWKNSGCPDINEKADKVPMQPYRKRPRTKFNPDELDLGSPELTKLWNIEPDLLKACRAPERKFAPSLADFIRGPLEEADPEQMVEEQYKSINNPAFQWRASRILLTSTSHFIASQTVQTTNIPKFLETVMINTGKNMDEFKAELIEREEKEAYKRAEESMLKNLIAKEKDGSGSPAPDGALTDEALQSLAKVLAGKCEQLGKALGVSEEKIEAIREGKEDEEATLAMLIDYSKESKSTRKLRNHLIEAKIITMSIVNILKNCSVTTGSSDNAAGSHTTSAVA